jgi:hypothetical protein
MSQTVTAFCKACRLQSKMEVVATVPRWDQGEDEWTVVRCPGCQARVLMTAQEVSSWETNYFQLFPQPEGSSATIPRHLPERVEKTYRAAMTCMEAGVPEAAAAMVGRCIEAIGRDRGARESDRDGLFVIIDRMVEQGVLTKSQGEVAHLLRGLRNDGAHDTDFAITADDALEAMKLLEMMCLSIYTIQRGYEELLARRAVVRAAPGRELAEARRRLAALRPPDAAAPLVAVEKADPGDDIPF